MEDKFPICKYCHQSFKREDEVVWIISKKYFPRKKKRYWLGKFKTKSLRKYHRRCWNKIERGIIKIENG